MEHELSTTQRMSEALSPCWVKVSVAYPPGSPSPSWSAWAEGSLGSSEVTVSNPV